MKKFNKIMKLADWRVEHQKKTSLHYTRTITPERITIGGAHLRRLAPG